VFILVTSRVVGKRATSQVNDFDRSATVAIGSILGSGILLKDVVATESAPAIAILFGAQYAVTKSTARRLVLSRVFRARARLLSYRGRYCCEAMVAEQIAAIRVVVLYQPLDKDDRPAHCLPP
jgi:uncharacterized membrane protein YcaP (DUF421 family)